MATITIKIMIVVMITIITMSCTRGAVIAKARYLPIASVKCILCIVVVVVAAVVVVVEYPSWRSVVTD